MNIRLLNANDIVELLSIKEAIAVVHDAFHQKIITNAVIPRRHVLANKIHKGFTAFMPCFLTMKDQLGIKIASYYENNRIKNLPSINGVVILLDNNTGLIKSWLDANVITALRTGAICGLATQLLAHPHAKNLALIGAGMQARHMLQAVCSVRKIKSLKIYNRTKANALTFIEEIKKHSITPTEIIFCDNIADAVREADIICTATAHKDEQPLLRANHLSEKPVHINAIGGATFNACEVDPYILTKSTIVVDHKATAQKEAGEIIFALNNNFIKDENIIELSQLVSNFVSTHTNTKYTFFKAAGFALLDIAIAEAIYTKAVSKNKGLPISYFTNVQKG